MSRQSVVKTKMVNVGIYPSIVIATTDQKEFKRLYAKRIGRGDIDLSHADGISSDRAGYFLVGVFNGEVGTLVHELAHTAFKILRQVNIPANHKHQEAFAYLQQWLFDELRETLN
jgi:hypothetical protein